MTGCMPGRPDSLLLPPYLGACKALLSAASSSRSFPGGGSDPWATHSLEVRRTFIVKRITDPRACSRIRRNTAADNSSD